VRTLVQPIERWLKIGHEPRAVLRITDATSGAELLRIGVEASGTAEDRMTGDSPRISRTIPHEGGMSTVGSVTIEDLILDDDLTLCTDLTIEPTIEGPVRGAGRLLSIGTPGEAYADVRDDTTSKWDDIRMVVGRWYTGSDTHVVARAPIQFAIPSTVTSCEDGYIALTGVNDYHGATHWSVHLVAGTWSALSEKGDMFDNFTGHVASGDYTLVDLGEAWTTEEYGAATYIQLNEAGRAAVVAAKGSSLKLMLVSDRDADFTTYSAGADGNEYVMFDAPSARLVLRTNTINLENQIASLYFGVDPLPADYTGMDLIYSGVVDRYDITDRRLSLTITPNDHKKNPMLPTKLITLDDWPNCPEENVGKAVPLVYGSYALSGEHRAGVGNFTGWGPLASQINFSYPDAFAALVVKEDDADRTALCTLLRLKSGNTSFYLWNDGAKTYTLYPVLSGIATYVAGKGTYRDITPDTDTSHIPPVLSETQYKGVATVIPSSNESTAGTYPERAYDADSDTYATMSSNLSELILYFQDPDGISTDGAIFFVAYAEFLIGADATKLNMIIERNTSTDVTTPSWAAVYTLQLWTGDAQKQYGFYLLNSTNDRSRLVLSQFRLRFTRPTDMTGVVNIYDVCALVAYSVQSPKVLYMNGEGHYDDTSGTVTGTASALIENPSHIIESIGRDEMGLATAEINTASFDTAATALTGMKMAFQISERKRAREYLKDIAYQGRMKLWWDDRDRLKAKVFDSTAAYPVSASNIPAALDVFTDTGEPSGDSFTTHQIVGEPKIRRRLDEMRNDFVFRYKLNHASGEYGAVITCNKDGTTLSDGDLSGVTGAELVALCQAAYDETGSVETLEVEAWAVRDDATAARTVQHLVQRLATMPWEITFEAGPSANVFEEADFVNIRCGVVQNRLGIAQMRKQKWEIIGHEPDVKGHDVGITAVQVV